MHPILKLFLCTLLSDIPSAFCSHNFTRTRDRSVAEEVGICKSSCHLILTDIRKMRRVAANFAPRLLTRHSFSVYFWRSMRRLLSPSRPILQIGPCRLFLVPEVEIRVKMSPISDGRGDRRKFDPGPSRRPAIHVPGRVSEMEKTLGVV